MAREILRFGFFEDFNVAFFAAGLEEYHGAPVAACACCAAYAVEVVVFAEGGIVFDYEVDVREIETAGCDVGADEDGRVFGCGEGFEGAGSCCLLEGAVEAVDFHFSGVAAGD